MLLQQFAWASLCDRRNILDLSQPTPLPCSLKQVHYDSTSAFNVDLEEYSLIHNRLKIKNINFLVYHLAICDDQGGSDELLICDFGEHDAKASKGVVESEAF